MDLVNLPDVSTPIQGSSSVVICVQGKHLCTCYKGGGDGGGGKVNKGGGGKIKVIIECALCLVRRSPLTKTPGLGSKRLVN